MKKRYEYKRGYLIDNTMDFKMKCCKALADDVIVKGWSYMATNEGFFSAAPIQKAHPNGDWYHPNLNQINLIKGDK